MDKLRDFLKSWPGRILLVICLSPLALLGIEGYLHGGSDPNQVAQVGEANLSMNEYQTALNARRSEILESLDDASLLNEDVLKQQVLKGLIDRKLLEQQTTKLGMTVSDDTISRLLQQEPIFLDDNGQFSNDKFAFFLRQRGMTKNQLFAEFRNQLSLDQLNSTLVSTTIYPDAAINELIDLQFESRPLKIHRFNWQDFVNQVKVTPEQITAYYHTHSDELKSKALVDLAYLKLSQNDIAVPEITQEELQQQYAAYKQDMIGQDERSFAQILITGDDAQQQAQKVKSEINNGLTFTEAAKQYSDDPSGETGGNIGKLNPAIFGEDSSAVNAAVQNLKQGDVSEPVKTQFGYQIFTVLEDPSPAVASFDEVKDKLTAKAKAYKQQTLYADKVSAINDLAADGFSIEDIAQQEGVAIARIKDYPKTDNQTVLSQPAVINQAFDEFTIHDQAVTTGIKLADGTVWVQPSNYRPVKTLSEQEAAPQITAALKKQQATQLAVKKAQNIKAKIRATGSIDFANIELIDLGVVNRQTPVLSDAERSAAFSEPVTAGGVAVITTPTEQGATLMVAGKMQTTHQTQLTAQQKQNTASMIKDNVGQDQLQDYLHYLRMVYDVKVNDANLASAQ